MSFRIEKDKLGEKEISEKCLWGIHTERAIENFKISSYILPFELIQALAMVKKAAASTNLKLKHLNESLADAIIYACDEIISGKYSEYFKIDAFQGGAGTSTNMNVNEVIANIALLKLNHNAGNYDIIHPIEHVNLFQSTNDVFPTAIKIAVVYKLRELSISIAALQGTLQTKENDFANILTIGRTELQDAVPITLGSQFASLAEAIARDRWRTYKCEERIRIVNIGGTAVGTGLTAPTKYIFNVIEELRNITGIGLSRAEQVMDQTANNDTFVEVAGMLRANAVNLIKIAKDLRLLHYFKEINLPEMQSGSSIMPGKVNPVIIESVITTCTKTINELRNVEDFASQGTLQINEFMPAIAYSMLESLNWLININKILAKHIIKITANEEVCLQQFNNSNMIITAFLPIIGYQKCEVIIEEFKNYSGIIFREFLNEKIGKELVDKTLTVSNLMSLGYK